MNRNLPQRNKLVPSQLIKNLTFVLVGLQLAACGDVRVSPAQEPQLSLKTDAHVCTEDPGQFGRNSKVMFIVDKSGSNSTTSSPTDPDLHNGRRITAIRTFFNKYKKNTNIYWGFITFAGSTVHSLIPPTPGSERLFTNDSQIFEEALQQFSSTADDGDTPYRAPIQLATSAVSTELKADQAEGITATYNLIFITDGEPTDGISNKELWNSAENLANLSPGSIHFSTVYYGPSNPKARNRLEPAAQKGQGVYQDTNVTPLINIEDLIQGGLFNEAYKVSDFVVYNMNAANCDDGSVGADSDSDGLCDKDEERYNLKLSQDPSIKQRMGGKKFDPTNRNSFSPVISDAIYYRYIVFNENINSDCTNTKDEDLDFVNECEEKFLHSESPQGPTPSWTAEMSRGNKNTNPHYFDSDGDGILDGLSYLFFRDKSAPMNYNNQFKWVNNRKQNGDLFRNHQNPLNPESEIGYGIEFNKSEPNNQGQNCYTYHQEQLPLYYNRAVSAAQTSGYSNLAHEANENVILIYYIQTLENSPNSKGILRYSFQKLKKDFNKVQDLSLDTSQFQIWPKPPPK